MKHLLPFSILLALLCSIYYTSAASPNVLVGDASGDSPGECSCYLTSGVSPGYFQHHRFWDFRSIPADGTNDFTLAPPFLSSTDDLINAPPTSAYLSTSDFVKTWSIQNWTSETDTYSSVKRLNSAQNIYISRNTTPKAEGSTYLTLRASRMKDFMSIAELESNQKNLLHSSVRARVRIVSVPNSANSSNTSNPTTLPTSPVPAGAVAGIFTYHSSRSESDIEILTRDPTNEIRYSNQPDYDPATDSTVPGASTRSTLPRNKIYTEWLDHRIDWFDGLSRFWVDGEMMLEKTMNVPRDPSGLILNLWSDGGEWSGSMSVGSQVVLGVEWIEMVFNISGPLQGPPPGEETAQRGVQAAACTLPCNIDGVKKLGFPELALTPAAAAAAANITTTTSTAADTNNNNNNTTTTTTHIIPNSLFNSNSSSISKNNARSQIPPSSTSSPSSLLIVTTALHILLSSSSVPRLLQLAD